MPTILSSNLVTVPFLDTLLSPVSGPRAPTPTKRVQLLSTKLAILTNRPSQPRRGQPFDVEIQILGTRLDLASAYLSLVNTALVSAANPGGSIPAGNGDGTSTSGSSSSGSGSASGGRGRERVITTMRTNVTLNAMSYNPLQPNIGDLKRAENELGIVEKECKGMIKRYSRLIRLDKDHEGDRREEDRVYDSDHGHGHTQGQGHGRTSSGKSSLGNSPGPTSASTSGSTSTSTSASADTELASESFSDQVEAESSTRKPVELHLPESISAATSSSGSTSDTGPTIPRDETHTEVQEPTGSNNDETLTQSETQSQSQSQSPSRPGPAPRNASTDAGTAVTPDSSILTTGISRTSGTSETSGRSAESILGRSERLRKITEIRIRGMRMMMDVEERMGRGDKRDRWGVVADRLEAEL